MLASQLPVPSVIPAIHHQFNEYLTFDLNWATIHAGVYFLYYLALEPVGAVSVPFSHTRRHHLTKISLSYYTAPN